MMRVLHVHSGNIYGGVETLLATLARHACLCPEMEAHYALCFDGRLRQELMAAGAAVHMLDKVRLRLPLTVLRARHMLGLLLQREPFDLVVCHSTWSQSIFGTVVRSAQLPFVFWLHGASNGRHWLDRWGRSSVPELVLCNSRFTARSLPHIFPKVRAEVIYCPVAPLALQFSEAARLATRNELQTPEDAVVVIQASRMEPWKGHTTHLEALGLLKDLDGWICWLVGGGQRPGEIKYLDRLKRLAAKLGVVDRVRFLGQRSDVPRLLRAADVYCQPNTGAEPFGLSFIEALAARLPVVTTNIGGALEIVNEACGLFVAPEDAFALATALQCVISNRELRQRLGNAGPERARELCDVKTQMQRLYQCFAAVCPEQRQIHKVTTRQFVAAS